MGRYVGIEETSDRRHPDTKVIYLRDIRKATAWAEHSGGFAWLASAQPDAYGGANYHRRFREIYEAPPGWRKPTAKTIEAERGRRPWEDGRGTQEILAVLVRRQCKAVPRG